MNLHRLACVFAGTLLALNGLASADNNLFTIAAQATSGPPRTVAVSSSDLPDLVTKLIKGQDQFAALHGQSVSATLQYAGIPSAITFDKNANNTSATVRIPSIGLTKTFNAKDANGLKDQIINYVRQEGADAYSRFLRVVNQQTPSGVTDGNPLAATALFADHQYSVFGLQPAPFPSSLAPDRLDAVSTPRFRFDIGGGEVSTSRGSGYFLSGALDVGFRFSDQVGLVFSSPFTYHTLEGAHIYDVGEEVALPIAFIPARGNGGLSWTLTPAGVAGAAGSLELAAGGTFAGGGVTSSLSYRLDSLTFTLADHYSYFHGYPIHVGHYSFDTNLEQQVLKNGVKVTKTFGDALFVDASITYTSFLERTATGHYWSPGAGIGVRFGPNAGLRIGYEGDFAHGFTINGGNIQLYFNY